MGNDLRMRGLPLCKKIIHLSLAGEIEPEKDRFPGQERGTSWICGVHRSPKSIASSPTAEWPFGVMKAMWQALGIVSDDGRAQ